MDKNQDIEIIKYKKLLKLTSDFCDNKLNDEYKDLCESVVIDLLEIDPIPFLKGKLEIWASAVIYALGQINFLFDKNSSQYLKPNEICKYFNTSKSTVGQKAKLIRDYLEMDIYDPDYSTQQALQTNPLNKFAILDNGILIPKMLLENKNQFECFLNMKTYDEIEDDLIKRFEEQLKKGKIQINNDALENYGLFLNKKINFPIKAKYIDKTDISGDIEYEVKVKKIINSKNSSSKEIKKGLFAECEYSGKTNKIPLLKLLGINNELINQYKNWYANESDNKKNN